MKGVAALALLLVNVHLSRCCDGEGQILFCRDIPKAFTPGYTSLVMILSDVGEINSTVFRSDGVASVTRLRIENAGITGIAEGAFGSFQNLTDLSLKHNLLTEIKSNWFGRPEILSELNLTENHIEVLNEFSLNGLISLTRLRLNKNRITTIDPNSFSSQTELAELDLSENRMTWVSLQVFTSLRSTRIRLDGNPWDCSCGAKDFVDFVKDLQSRSLLDRQVEVTCETPPSLRGQPVWNVSVCVTSPDNLTVQPSVTPSTVVTAPPSHSTPKTDISVQPKPTDAPLITSSHAVRPTSETKTSDQPKPTDILTATSTPTLTTETSVTSPPSVTEISVHPKPSDLPVTVSTPPCTDACVTSRPSSDTNTVCTLIVVIVVLSLLLCLVCFLMALYRRKRHNKTVTPGGPKENRNESKEEDDSRSSRDRSPGCSEKGENNQWDSEMGRRRSFTGVRAKSASAILSTSPFCSPVKDQVSLQTETEAQMKESEHQTEGTQQPRSQTEVDEGLQTENLETNSTKRGADGRNLDKDPRCVPVNTDTVPYLSIGTNQKKPDDCDRRDDPGQRLPIRKVLGRISTWPPTVTQWKARCKMMEKEEKKGSDGFTVWTSKFPGEVKKELNNVEHPFREPGVESDQVEDPLNINMDRMKGGLSQSSKPKDETTEISEAHAHIDMKHKELKMEKTMQEPATVISETQNLSEENLGTNQNVKPGEKIKSSDRTEPQQALTSRRRAENRSTGSKAPSGGASPDDETLLSGNEYAFMDLLHEVVQNNGRWTRERWRQIHVNKQRR